MATAAPEVKILFLSAHWLWAQAMQLLLETRFPAFKVQPCVTEGGVSLALRQAVVAAPQVVVVSLDNPAADLAVVQRIQPLIGPTPLLVLCSQYLLPALPTLEAAGVRGVIGSRAGVEDLVALIYALVDDRADPLPQQYLRAVRPLYHQTLPSVLTLRQRELLRLVANDLTDQEIASQLGLSVRTVSNQLYHLYKQLGVRGRAGAAVLALVRGWIPLPSVAPSGVARIPSTASSDTGLTLAILTDDPTAAQ
ncbi:MAG: LuxR C-terminal-related transcriptional regulator [Chloroflexota bacterium]|nr:LuxR C-terminal-related transcriptional regulator [Chloroflexota bacterium]